MKSIFRKTICSYSSVGFRLQLVLTIYINKPFFQVLLNRKIVCGSYVYVDAVNYFVQRIQSHSLLINPVSQFNNLFFKDFNHG